MKNRHIYKEEIPEKKSEDAFEEGRTIPFQEPEESEENND